MARIIDFNKLEQPTLPLIMRDEKHTELNVVAPTEELIEKLEANYDIIQEACKPGKAGSLDKAYELAAEFISCNLEGIKVTGDELRNVYKVNYLMLTVFMVNYLEFIDEIKNAKN